MPRRYWTGLATNRARLIETMAPHRQAMSVQALTEARTNSSLVGAGRDRPLRMLAVPRHRLTRRNCAPPSHPNAIRPEMCHVALVLPYVAHEVTPA